MHDLRSHRLDHPGRPSEDELPKKPFGLFDLPEVNEPVKKPTEWTIEREAGLRTSKLFFLVFLKVNRLEFRFIESLHNTAN